VEYQELVNPPWHTNWVVPILRPINILRIFMVNYNFDGSKLKQAHEWCQSQVEMAMIQNHITSGLDSSDIVVSNTFTQEWEMKHYYELAVNMGIKYSVLLWKTDMVVLMNTEYLRINYR
jgi:hypothetical protein